MVLVRGKEGGVVGDFGERKVTALVICLMGLAQRAGPCFSIKGTELDEAVGGSLWGMSKGATRGDAPVT